MARMYTASFSGVAVTALQDLFEIVAPSTGVAIIHQVDISQGTDVGDAEEEMLLVHIRSGATTSGSGGSIPSAVPILLGDAAADSTVEANNTTKASGGTIVTHWSFYWNIRVALQMIFTPETRPVVTAGARLTVELDSAPADSITMSGTLVWEEIS